MSLFLAFAVMPIFLMVYVAMILVFPFMALMVVLGAMTSRA